VRAGLGGGGGGSGIVSSSNCRTNLVDGVAMEAVWGGYESCCYMALAHATASCWAATDRHAKIKQLVVMVAEELTHCKQHGHSIYAFCTNVKVGIACKKKGCQLVSTCRSGKHSTPRC